MEFIVSVFNGCGVLNCMGQFLNSRGVNRA